MYEHLILAKSGNGNCYIYNANSKDINSISENVFNKLNYFIENKIIVDCDDFKEKTKNLKNNDIDFFKQLLFQSNKNKIVWETKISNFLIIQNFANNPQIVFEVTEDCNLDCTYCTYGNLYKNNFGRGRKQINTKAAKNLIKFVVELCKNNEYSNNIKNQIVLSFYGGEPLLNIQFLDEIIEFSKTFEDEKIEFSFSMTTNAVLLYKHIEFLMKNKFRILVSLDGNEYNHSYRKLKSGKNSFNIVFENLKKVQVEFPEYFERNITFNSVLHNRNSSKEASNFIFDKFGKYPLISELTSDNINQNEVTKYEEMFKNKYEDLKQSENYFNKPNNIKENVEFQEVLYFIVNSTNLTQKNYFNFFINNITLLKPTGTCLPFGRKIFVTADGLLLSCENIAHSYSLGKISENGVDISFENTAKIYSSFMEKLKPLCEKCYRSTNCGQCMYYLNLESKNPKCYGFVNKKEYSKYLGEIFTIIENNPDFINTIIEKFSLQ